MEKIPHIEKIGQWWFKRMGNTGYIEIYPVDDNEAITMDGSDVTRQIHIRYVHRICNITLTHLDSSFDESLDSLKCILERPQDHVPAMAKMKHQPYREYDLTGSKIIKAFKDFEVAPINPCLWSLTLNTTNTDVVIPVLKIQVLGGAMREIAERS